MWKMWERVHEYIKKTRYCGCGFELGGSFVGNPPQPKCPASVEILSSPEGSMRSIKVTPNDDRNFAFVSGTEAICHTNKCLQLQRTLVASDKLQEFSCHHIKADLSEPIYLINFTSEEIESRSESRSKWADRNRKHAR